MRGNEFLSHAMYTQFSKIHPQVAAFLKDYLKHEKAIEFRGKYVLNTHFPPCPSPAFDNMVEQFNSFGKAGERRLFSVTFAVTNRCQYSCWHCYNAGRSQRDLPLSVLKNTVRQLQEMKAAVVALTGGEPLLRSDLEEVIRAFDETTCLVLNTTGAGLTQDRAQRLKDSRLFALGVSLDSENPAEHDRMRGKRGAFDVAVAALSMAAKAGLYSYVISVGTHELLEPTRFESFMRFAAGCGALEVHLIEPSATGKLAGNTEALLTEEERDRILYFQHEMADRDDMPILSSFQYLESPQAFGCGAGLTHLYIDGAGEVCPCNLVPLSFGNVAGEPLAGILEKMSGYFCKPRTECVGRTLSPYICGDSMPLDSEASARICRECLPKRHKVPRFFRVQEKAREEVGKGELKIAYNRIHGSYDHFWLSEAGKPIDELVDRVKFKNGQHVCEVGCGTGYGTALIADRLGASGDICAVDLSDGMLSEARARAVSMNIKNARFINQDALEFLNTAGSYDVIFSSWVLGYIPLAPFLLSARHALAPDGRIAFVVHKENSPREQLEIFWEIIAEDPSVLKKRVAFDFPRNIEHTQQELAAAGFEAEQIWEGKICFQYLNPKEVLEHLLKSGAGTAFYDAVDRRRRKALKQRFIDVLSSRRQNKESYFVVHDYISCIARKKEIV